jgi:hypothetical protein
MKDERMRNLEERKRESLFRWRELVTAAIRDIDYG